MSKFNPKDFEKKWQDKWKEQDIYKTPEIIKGDDKAYILDMYPYPSGSGLHVGHPRGYLATDVVSRYYRMIGKKVLHPMGFDSFGLPAENYAIKTGTPPEESTDKAIQYFKEQIGGLGMSYDWDRELMSHDPEFMRWTQWMFLKLYENGLAYLKEAPVNWCPTDQTVLANEQVEPDGTCERCGTEVVQKNLKQWFFKITDYADKLIDDLDKIDWPESTKLGQKNWIGRKTGINITYDIENTDETVTCFTTRPDTNFGATFVVCAPDGEFIKKNLERLPNKEAVEKYAKETSRKTELERQQEGKKKTGVFTGWYAINNLNGKKMPIYVSDFVLAGFGTGNVVGVPAHDLRDFQFAKAMGDIEVIRVVVGSDGDESEITEESQVQEDDGHMINSEFLDGMYIHDATTKIMDYIVENGYGKKVTTYRLRDWLVSRQRYWGCPIPIVFDPEGNPHPVKEEHLPLRLPTDVDYNPKGKSPVASSESYKKLAEELYGEGWHFEVDTMDTFVDSTWYFFRFTDNKNSEEFASKENINSWMPVDLYVGGAEHTVLHLMYARFYTKFLFDQGIIDFDEPFQKLRHQGMILAEDSRKMSKRWGNTIDPNDEIEKFGADTLRVYEMFMGPFEGTLPWSTETEIGVNRFLSKVWDNFEKITEEKFETQEKEINKLIKYTGNAIETMSFNTAVAKFMEFNNFLNKEKEINKSVFERYLQLLAPFAPFITEELWSKLGNEFSIHRTEWPSFDEAMTIDDVITLAVQINGKVRGAIEINRGDDQDSVYSKAMEVENIKKYVEGEPKKIIYIQDRILNVIV